MIQKIHQYSLEVQNEFSGIEQKWSQNFDEQQDSQSRIRSKNRKIKRKMKDLESQSQVNLNDQKEIEKSLLHISKVHDQHTNMMGR